MNGFYLTGQILTLRQHAAACYTSYDFYEPAIDLTWLCSEHIISFPAVIYAVIKLPAESPCISCLLQHRASVVCRRFNAITAIFCWL